MAGILEQEKKAQSAYTPRGVYKDAGLSAADNAAIADLKRQWAEAEKAGDRAAMETAHQRAEAIRAGYGYSGGGDGTEYIAVQKTGGTGTAGARAASQGVSDYSEYIRQMNQAAREKSLAALKGAYEQNMAALGRTEQFIKPQYREAKDQAAAQSALAKRQFAEYAAAHGLSSGTAGQAELSRSNALQGNLRALGQAESDALADAALQRSQMESSYRNAVAQARAGSEYELAQQLYQEQVRAEQAELSARQQEWQQELSERQMAFQQEQAALSAQQWERQMDYQQGRDTVSDQRYQQELEYQKGQNAASAAQQRQENALALAKQLAAYGDFSGYKALGVDTSGMEAAWAAQEQAAAQQSQVAVEQQQRENALALAKQLAAYGDFSGYAALGVDTTQMRADWEAERAAKDVEIQKAGNGGTPGGTGPVTYDAMRPKAKEFADRIYDMRKKASPGVSGNALENYYNGLAKEILLAMEEGDISVDEGYYLTKMIGR